jgi:hypothetical protein
VKAAAHLGFLLDAGFIAMVQPYQRFIDERGETGMVYFNGQLSHSFRKGAILATGENIKNGLFTVEDIAPRTASAQERELGKAVMTFVKICGGSGGYGAGISRAVIFPAGRPRGAVTFCLRGSGSPIALSV